jgi:hypothetical protein
MALSEIDLIPHSSLRSSGNAAALSIYGDAF